MPQRADELAAQAVEVGGDHEEQQPGGIGGEGGEPPKQGGGEEQKPEAEEVAQQPDGEDAPLVAAPLQAEADDGAADAHRGQGEEEGARLDEQLGGAVVRRGEHPGVEGHEKKDQHLGAEAADGEEGGIGDQSLIGVHGVSPPRGPDMPPVYPPGPGK